MNLSRIQFRVNPITLSLLLFFVHFSCGRNDLTSEMVLVRESSTVTRTATAGVSQAHWVNFTNVGPGEPTNVRLTLPRAPFKILRSECGTHTSPETKFYNCLVYYEFFATEAGTYTDKITLEYNRTPETSEVTSITVDLNFTVN